jgi:Asp-tRNA(Asn)/Glu-tRNA(Gln) amidotransferase B subunit
MTDNRKRILDMLEAGKISAAEAMKLLEAMEKTGTEPRREVRKIKYLRVLIDNPGGEHGGSKADKVNVRVPVSLIRAGMKFTSLIPQDAADQVEGELKKKGISLNLKNLKDEDIEELIAALAELEVDIDGGEGKVRVFAE